MNRVAGRKVGEPGDADGLAPGELYDLYCCAEDASGNFQAVAVVLGG